MSKSIFQKHGIQTRHDSVCLFVILALGRLSRCPWSAWATHGDLVSIKGREGKKKEGDNYCAI